MFCGVIYGFDADNNSIDSLIEVEDGAMKRMANVTNTV